MEKWAQARHLGCVEAADAPESLESLLDAWALLEQDVQDTGGGMLIADVKDDNRNLLG